VRGFFPTGKGVSIPMDSRRAMVVSEIGVEIPTVI